MIRKDRLGGGGVWISDIDGQGRNSPENAWAEGKQDKGLDRYIHLPAAGHCGQGGRDQVRSGKHMEVGSYGGLS